MLQGLYYDSTLELLKFHTHEVPVRTRGPWAGLAAVPGTSTGRELQQSHIKPLTNTSRGIILGHSLDSQQRQPLIH